MHVEHCFGWLKRRFPFIAVPRQQSVPNRVSTVWMCCALHNFLIDIGDGFGSNEGVPVQDRAYKSYEKWIKLGVTNTHSPETFYDSRGRPSQQKTQLMTGEYMCTV